MNKNQRIKQILNDRLLDFDYQEFVEHDPISVVYQMKNKPNSSPQDIELCAIFTAMISWGQRTHIISHAIAIMERCNWEPYKWLNNCEFRNISDDEVIYRTLNGEKFKKVCWKLFEAYQLEQSLMHIVKYNYEDGGIDSVINFLTETLKPAKLGTVNESACKRICMFLRWMSRPNHPDLGIWTFIKPSDLYAIMDAHVIKQSNQLGLLDYKTASWKAMLQLTEIYRSWDIEDPLKYDMVLMDLDIKKQNIRV